jgi:hypothetical protein
VRAASYTALAAAAPARFARRGSGVGAAQVRLERALLRLAQARAGRHGALGALAAQPVARRELREVRAS